PSQSATDAPTAKKVPAPQATKRPTPPSYPSFQPIKKSPPRKPLVADSTPTTRPSARAALPFSVKAVPKSTGRVQQPHSDPAPEISENKTRAAIPLKQITTSPLPTIPVQVANTIYFATRDGDFYALDATSTDLLEQRKLDSSVKRLVVDGSKLNALGINKPPLTLREFDQAIDALDPEDVEANGKPLTLGDKPLPPAWTEREPHF